MTTSEPVGCFVFIQLPGGTDVVCGRLTQERLAGSGCRSRFVYARSYRERPNAVPIDPFELPLDDGTFEQVGTTGVFGAIRDAAPDAWGRRVIEWRSGGELGSEIDYLLHSPEDRAGALSFGTTTTPPAPGTTHRILDLEALQAIADEIDRGAPVTGESPVARIAQLIDPGTSMGGARPKAVVQDSGAYWLAKFGLRGDRWNVPACEAAMLDLAEQCGIRVAERRLVVVAGRVVLLVKRFDRAGVGPQARRFRMVSAKTVLRAGDGVTEREAWSYPRLADELRRWVRDPLRDQQELFRRMVFNALISNLDDHPRNHALLAPEREWEISPAYDLTPTPVRSVDRRDLALVIGRLGRWANRGNLLSESARFGFTREEATEIIEAQRQVVATRWRECILERGGTEADLGAVAPAFCYPGFDYE